MAYTIGSHLLHAEDREIQHMAEQAIIEEQAPDVHDRCPKCHNTGIFHKGPMVEPDGTAHREYTCMLCEHEWTQRWRTQ